MSSVNTAGAIQSGGSMAGTNMESLLQATNYSIVCGMEIENWTKWSMEDPVIIPISGQVSVPPRSVNPGQREAVITHKSSGGATGTYGTVSWLIRVPSGDRRVVVTWSAPYNFNHYSNYLTLGITRPGEIAHQENWTRQMYYKETSTTFPFVRGEYYYQSREIKIEDEDIVVQGGMGTTHKTRMYVHVKPKKSDNCAPGLIMGV